MSTPHPDPDPSGDRMDRTVARADEASVPTAVRVEAALTPRDWGAFEWKGRFLVAFARTLNVAAACRASGRSTTHVYDVKKSDPEFRAAWQEAQVVAIELREAILDRAILHGQQETTTRTRIKRAANEAGQLVVVEEESTQETTMKHSPTLLMFALRAHRPDRYRDRVEHRHGLADPLGLDEGPRDDGDGIWRVPTAERMVELARLAVELEIAPIIEGNGRIVPDGGEDE